MQPEQDQAHLNRSRLQETELVVIAWLLRRRNAVVLRELKRGRALTAIAAALESEMQSAIIEARKVSRAAGRTRLQQELQALGLSAVPTQNDLRTLAADVYRAGKIAKSYAARWLKTAERSESDDAPELALAATVGSIERIGASENAEAFNAERVSGIQELDFKIWRVWDATLDVKTCPVCARADGTIVLLDEPFPLGEPGDVHPWCRCTTWLTTIRP